MSTPQRGRTTLKLSWEDTARAMAERQEDWSAWDGAAADAVEHLPWHPTDKDRAAT